MRAALRITLLAGALSGCHHSTPAPEPKPESKLSLVITLERTACMGRCPVYSVAIEGTGAVRFEGKQFVQHAGPHNANIPAAAVDSLVAELRAGGFFDLADRYAYGAPACGRYATDLPSAIVSVTVGDSTRRVEHDHGCTDAPPALAQLENRIDEVAGTATWIGER